MKRAQVFIYITYFELSLLGLSAIYIYSTKNMELGAVVIGFIFLTLLIYYSIYCTILDSLLKKGKDAAVFPLVFFNVLPFLFYTYMFVFG